METRYQRQHNPELSPKYRHADTDSMLARLETKGWGISQYVETKVRNPAKQGKQTHIVRLRHPAIPSTDEGIPEVILKNNHWGESSVTGLLGYFRGICSNGLIFGSWFCQHRVRHIGKGFDARLDVMLDQLLGEAYKVPEVIGQWQATPLQLETIQELADKVAEKRLEATNPDRITNTLAMVRANREEDRGGDAWKVYNRLQENALRASLQYLPRPTEKRPRPGFRFQKAPKSPVARMDLNQYVFDAVADAVKQAA